MCAMIAAHDDDVDDEDDDDLGDDDEDDDDLGDNDTLFIIPNKNIIILRWCDSVSSLLSWSYYDMIFLLKKTYITLLILINYIVMNWQLIAIQLYIDYLWRISILKVHT